jgi:hypothetical protein
MHCSYDGVDAMAGLGNTMMMMMMMHCSYVEAPRALTDCRRSAALLPMPRHGDSKLDADSVLRQPTYGLCCAYASKLSQGCTNS